MQSSVPVQEKVTSPAVSGLRVDTKGPAPVKELSLEDANGVKALVASNATPESATNKDPRSPEKSPLMKDNAEKPIGDQGCYYLLTLLLFVLIVEICTSNVYYFIEQTNIILAQRMQFLSSDLLLQTFFGTELLSSAHSVEESL